MVFVLSPACLSSSSPSFALEQLVRPPAAAANKSPCFSISLAHLKHDEKGPTEEARPKPCQQPSLLGELLGFCPKNAAREGTS